MDGPEKLWAIGAALFTLREWDMLPLLVRGKSNQEMADHLVMSVRTAEGHIARLFEKINVDNRTEVAHWYDTVLHGSDFWKAVYTQRVEGHPKSAISTAKVLGRLLEGEIAAGHRFPLLLSRTQGLLLYEKSAAYREIQTPEEVFNPVTPLYRKIKRIAKFCRSDELEGLAAYTVADAHYIRKEFGEAAFWLEKAAGLVQDIDDRLRILRVQGIALANVGEAKQFLRVEKEATRIIENGDTSNEERICETWEGLARALGVLRLSLPPEYKLMDPFEALNKGWAVYTDLLAENPSSPPYVRGLQLYRTEGVLIRILSPGNKPYFLSRGGEMIALANRLPYRIKEQLPELLE